MIELLRGYLLNRKLFKAAENADLPGIRELLEQGADPLASRAVFPLGRHYMEMPTGGCETVLDVAAWRHGLDHPVCRFLKEAGAVSTQKVVVPARRVRSPGRS